MLAIDTRQRFFSDGGLVYVKNVITKYLELGV